MHVPALNETAHLVRVDVDVGVPLCLLRRRPHKAPDGQVVGKELVPGAGWGWEG